MEKNKMYYLSDGIRRVRLQHERIIKRWYEYHSTFFLLNDYSINLYSYYAQGHLDSILELQNWHLECIGKDKNYIRKLNLCQEDIQLATARQFGYTDWHHIIMDDTDIDPILEKVIDIMMEGQFEEYYKQCPPLSCRNSKRFA